MENISDQKINFINNLSLHDLNDHALDKLKKHIKDSKDKKLSTVPVILTIS